MLYSTEVTATHHFTGQYYASCLMIDDPVRLVRDRANAKDPNAIRVELITGDMLGFIERTLAAQIAPLLDGLASPVTALISGLEGGRFAADSRIKISFILDDQSSNSPKALQEYCFDASRGHSYVLFDATPELFNHVLDRLKNQNFICPTSGVSHKPAVNSRQYQWYIRVARPGGDPLDKPVNATEEEIDGFFMREYSICSPAGRLRDLQKLIEAERQKLQDIQYLLDESEEDLAGAQKAIEDHKSEAASAISEALEFEETAKKLQTAYDIKAREAAELHEQRNALRGKVAAIERQEQHIKNMQNGVLTNTASDLNRTVSLLLPHISFLRDSLDELVCLPDPASALKAIGTIARNPEGLKSERFEGTEFKELRYSTGQNDNGRIYYRCGKTATEVLVSKKQMQGKMDKDYLAKR